MIPGAVIVLTLAVIPALADEVEVISTFEGNKGPGFKPAANVMGGVGPKHVVDFTIGGFTVHDKATGTVLVHWSQREFWSRVEPVNTIVPVEHANDPWMVYDTLSNRWLAVAAGTHPGDSFLAVSTSADPTQIWRGAKLPLPKIDPGLKIGVDKHGVYISCANGSPDLMHALDLYVIPKADVISQDGPVLANAKYFANLIYSAVPAVDLNPTKAKSAPAVLLNNEFGETTCSKLFLYRINWDGTKPAISKVQPIPLSRIYATPRMHGVQPDGGVQLVQAGGRRNYCAFVHGGSVFGCQMSMAWRTFRLSTAYITQGADVARLRFLPSTPGSFRMSDQPSIPIPLTLERRLTRVAAILARGIMRLGRAAEHSEPRNSPTTPKCT